MRLFFRSGPGRSKKLLEFGMRVKDLKYLTYQNVMEKMLFDGRISLSCLALCGVAVYSKCVKKIMKNQKVLKNKQLQTT